ncbi:MAG: DUF397 domain-containing protein, partial [Parcubacteria group bacterium]
VRIAFYRDNQSRREVRNMPEGFSFPVEDKDFRKSSRSRIITWCVEVAVKPEGVALRDSKNHKGGTLFFNNAEWKAFTGGVKDGEFDIVG